MGFDLQRSKLEVYVDILQLLAQRGLLNQSQVMHSTNLNSNVLRGHLSFLIREGLIEKRIAGKKSAIYEVNQSGVNVVRYFRESKKAFPVIEETQKGSSTSSF
jgi:predicted transcriptional regulator